MVIAILALQGAFIEHEQICISSGIKRKSCGTSVFFKYGGRCLTKRYE